MTTHEQRAYDLFIATSRLASKMIADEVLIQYCFDLYIEDPVHGGMLTGTSNLSCDAIVPLMRPTTNTVFIKDGSLRTRALHHGSVDNLRCQIIITLYNTSSAITHSFHSKAPVSSNSNHTLEVPDVTCQPGVAVPAPSVWNVLIYFDAKRQPLALNKVEFTHDPAAHRALVDLLAYEASDGYQNIARSYMAQTDIRRPFLKRLRDSDVLTISENIALLPEAKDIHEDEDESSPVCVKQSKIE